MQERVTKLFRDSQEYWNKIPKKRQRYAMGIAAGVVVLAIVLAVVLNTVGSGYVVLYPGMSSEESTELLSELGIRNVPNRVTADGEVMVPRTVKDDLLVELAILGFPKSTLTYDIFSSATGFTTTEFERQQYLLFQTQERIQSTLARIDNVSEAIVTLNVPSTDDYVWEDDSQKSTASVLLTFSASGAVSTEMVSGIKNLVASSVPNLNPIDVHVVDAATGIELNGGDDSLNSVEYELMRMGLEEQVERDISDKILNVLTLGYNPEDIRISTTVVLDYDKMITESMEYIGNEDNEGVLSSEQYSAVGGGDLESGGVVGEENNTDVPIYVTDENGDMILVDYNRQNEYLVSYVKQQVEKDQATIDDATVSIAIRDNELTDQKRAQIIESASTASNVGRDRISIMAFEAEIIETELTGVEAILANPLILAIIVGAVLLIIIVIVIIMMAGRKKRAAVLAEEEAKMLFVDGVQFNTQAEVEAYKQQLKDATEASKNSKENVIIEEVRDFAKTNPDITAQLIRTWLHGEETPGE